MRPYLFTGARMSVVVLTAAALSFVVSAALALPPPNDYFANATTVAALPYTDTVDMTEATTEYGEYMNCDYSTQTVWYRFTPASDTWLHVQPTFSFYTASVTVWKDTGSGIQGLNWVTCSDQSGVSLLVHPGSTYYFEGKAPCCYLSGNLQISFTQTQPPQPVCDFNFYPSDPSVFDRVQFYDNSYDPGGQGIQSRVWDYGDGDDATAPGDSSGAPGHVYGSDGDYVVTLKVTTTDGRTATASHTVPVRTHDVAITQFKVPQSASAGQTRQVVVGVRNNRYPENVTVMLEVSQPGNYYNFGQVGMLQQFVPVRSSNRTTDFAFNYTFTASDAAIGKVVFRATATLTSARDALNADNVAVSLPTKVAKAGASETSPSDLPEVGVSFALLGVQPNPARVGVDLVIRLSLPPAETAAKLQLIDLGGRVVAERDLGALGVGTHDARLEGNSRLSPGVYWVRLSQGAQSVTKRVVLR
jgi:PKD domain-containing protein